MRRVLIADDELGKPFRPDEVLLVLRKAEERERLRRENLRLRREASRRTPQLVAEGPAMKEVMRVVQKVAPTPTTVLIEGESGTGKELVARALHDLSSRAERPFVAVNCGGIPETLIESELFGHAKGAFTDARTAKRGLFEEADGGTLLLDEIGELPLAVQPSPGGCSRATRRGSECRRAASRRARSNPSRPTAGRGTCASWRTRSSARWCCRRTTRSAPSRCRRSCRSRCSPSRCPRGSTPTIPR